jgi:hypothetical protein
MAVKMLPESAETSDDDYADGKWHRRRFDGDPTMPLLWYLRDVLESKANWPVADVSYNDP